MIHQSRSGLIISPSIVRIENIFIDNRAWGTIFPFHSSSGMQSGGIYNDILTDTTSSRNNDPDGHFFQQDTAALIDSDAAGNVNAFIHRPNYNFEVFFKFALLNTTNVRFWVVAMGATSYITTMAPSDTPVLPYVGIRFSTSAGDVNWRFMSSDAVGTNNIDSGIPVSTAARFVHIISIDQIVPQFIVRILDENFIELAVQIFTTLMPIPTQEISIGLGARALAAEIKSLKHYMWVGINKI